MDWTQAGSWKPDGAGGLALMGAGSGKAGLGGPGGLDAFPNYAPDDQDYPALT